MSIFFGDYKRVRTRYKREKEGFVQRVKKNGDDSCAGCAGDCKK